ncbi:hypothetical protein TNCV_2606811 [Trichonephila clavipes]|uniref:Uncharacterized protein n=1 Tax=Trichonephila clavipes TaxID=2585209 RepID=A0A8X6VBK1_TRICX|nr:hypothetical protein TNCV_2606811 [Trichonephila clavipes]
MQLTVALHIQWRIVIKGGKTATVGRKGLPVGACVRHLQVCGETRGVDDWRIMRQWCSNELRIKDRLIWAHQ